jgi:tRNA-dihydrouridine synthase A
MMDWTDVHFRSLARLLSRRSWLYTEMVVDAALLHSADAGRFLEFPESQRPVVCQLGGSDPAKLAAAAAVAARYGYDEINLNCGCPSDRVAGAGCFGASLMREPGRVAEACRAMREAVRAVEARGEAGAAMREVGGWGGGRREAIARGGPGGEAEAEAVAAASASYRPPRPIDVTVKCRLGVDDLDSYAALCDFVRVVSSRGQVSHFVVHARKCHLQGLSPAQNRSVPPLRHGWVFALRRDFPGLRFTLNGGLESTAAARDALLHDFGSVARAAEGEAGEEAEAGG